ncbi:glycosyltransferase family 4 protein [Demequina soli]|uniref:glycosyltransferase family 4 protein n=1 Tax=Demequina soli TaxID=1638987 RepID=UPI000785AE9F|nr:glycosyltransferase family 4 protein [Demequina soli]
MTWLASHASPYRRPVWQALSRRFDFEAAMLESQEQFRKHQGNRPADFHAAAIPGVALRTVRSLRVERGRILMYANLGRTMRRGTDAVILGGWESPAYIWALLSARLRRVRTVAFYENTLAAIGHSAGPVARVRDWFFRSCDAVVVPGRAAEAAVLSFGVPAARIHRGFNAVDVSAFAAAALEAPARSGGGHRFVFVGQLIDRKRPLETLEAFALCASADDELVFVGSGPLAEDLRLRAESLPRLSVSFVDNVPYDRMPALLADSDTLVLVSNEEVWGLVVNEALAAGCGAIVSDVCGVAPDVEGMEGVEIVDGSVAAVADAMRRRAAAPAGRIVSPAILTHDPEAFASVFAEAIEG